MTLKEKYAPYFKIGAAVNSRTVETRADLLRAHFNSLTCENEMKPALVVPNGADYDFARADAIAGKAREWGMALRLHTLVWHRQTPVELYEGKTREQAIAAMDAHFARLAEKYASQVCAIDVVNEAISDEPGEYLREAPLKGIIGEDYIDIAYTLARKRFPGIALVYNDYSECDPEKSAKIHRLVSGMLERGIAVDAVGLQSHYAVDNPSLDDVRRAWELYASLGLRLQVTELDVSLHGHREPSTLTEPPRELLERQADYYAGLFGIYREYASAIDSVTFWGVCDSESWLNNFPVVGRPDWPLLFDASGAAKSCFEAIMDF